jgi:hypothetical protein
MRNLAIFLFLLSSVTFLNAQTDRLNQVDSLGKKTGVWIVYLNKNWKQVRDTNKAVFYRYKYYEKGIDIQSMGWCGKKWNVSYTGGNGQQGGGITQLDGEYKWTDKKGGKRCIATFKNGECLTFKWFYPSGAPQSVWDYTKKYKDQPYSYWFAEYDKKGGVREYYFRKNRQCTSGWYCFPAAND